MHLSKQFLTFSPYLKLNTYIWSIARKIINSPYHLKKFTTPSARRYFTKSDQKWSIVALFGLVLTNTHFRFFTQLCGGAPYFPPFSPFSTESMTQTYRYYHDNCSHEFYSLVSPIQNFAVKTCLATSIRFEFPSSLRVYHLWNKHPYECLLEDYNLNLFRSRVNYCLSAIYS